MGVGEVPACGGISAVASAVFVNKDIIRNQVNHCLQEYMHVAQEKVQPQPTNFIRFRQMTSMDQEHYVLFLLSCKGAMVSTLSKHIVAGSKSIKTGGNSQIL